MGIFDKLYRKSTHSQNLGQQEKSVIAVEKQGGLTNTTNRDWS